MLDNRMAEEPAEVVESPTTETEPVTTPEVEETQPEVAKENAETPQEAPEVTPEPKPSRAEKKIRDLWKENAELKAQMEALSQRQSPEFEQGEIDARTLDSVINQRAIEAARLIVESQNVGNELKNQTTEWAKGLDAMVAKYPQLDSKSPEFDRELAEDMAEALIDGDGNPKLNKNPIEFIERSMQRINRLNQKAKEEGKAEVSVSLAKQSQEGALTPSSKTSKTEDYSQDQIEKIATTNPRLYTELVMKGKI